MAILLIVSIFSNSYFIHLILSTYLLYSAFQIVLVTHTTGILNFYLLSIADSPHVESNVPFILTKVLQMVFKFLLPIAVCVCVRVLFAAVVLLIRIISQ